MRTYHYRSADTVRRARNVAPLALWGIGAAPPLHPLIRVIALTAAIAGATRRSHRAIRTAAIRHARRRLGVWCSHLGVPLPEVLDWHETANGEEYALRVTQPAVDGEVMTVARWQSLAGPMRDVIGDECRRVDVWPDAQHGGRCRLAIQWRDPAPPAERDIITPRFVEVAVPTQPPAAPVAVGPSGWQTVHRYDPEFGLVFYDLVRVSDDAEDESPHAPLPEVPTCDPDRGESADGGRESVGSTPIGGVVAGEWLEPFVGASSGSPLRPLNAREGTRTGALWEALCMPGGHSRTELADAAELAPGTVANTLRDWERLGLATTDGGLWQATCATLPDDGLDAAV